MNAAKQKPAASKVPWKIHFFMDPSDGAVPGRDFLAACPTSVRAKIVAAPKAVADAPPPAFSGGGYWEAMHGEMTGLYEVRADGAQRRHFRLFCLLDRGEGDASNLGGPSIVILTGLSKAFRTTLKPRDYQAVRDLADLYYASKPRSVYASKPRSVAP